MGFPAINDLGIIPTGEVPIVLSSLATLFHFLNCTKKWKSGGIRGLVCVQFHIHLGADKTIFKDASSEFFSESVYESFEQI